MDGFSSRGSGWRLARVSPLPAPMTARGASSSACPCAKCGITGRFNRSPSITLSSLVREQRLPPLLSLTPDTRRVACRVHAAHSGYAAQSLFASVLLAAAGIRKIRAFLNRAVEDANGDHHVKRHMRTCDHACTHLPPGSNGTRGDPCYDENVETFSADQGAA